MSRPTLLVAEDDPGSNEMLREMFEAAGYEVELAQTAREVVAALRDRRFAAVLLDLTLPGMTRHELVDALRGLPARSPLIVFSARPAAEVRAIADLLGAVAVLPKPSGMDELLATLAGVAGPAE